MSDIICAVCGEPYDEFLDMLPWERDLFKQGAGCPCCEGVGPNTEAIRLEHAKSVMMNSENPDDYPVLMSGGTAQRPPWVKPPDELLWTCEGCKVNVRKAKGDDDYSPDELYWEGGERVHYYHGNPFAYGTLSQMHEDPTSTPLMLENKPYCPGCLGECWDCKALVFLRTELDPGDPYEPGASFMSEMHHHTICTNCHENESRDLANADVLP